MDFEYIVDTIVNGLFTLLLIIVSVGVISVAIMFPVILFLFVFIIGSSFLLGKLVNWFFSLDK